MKNRKEYRHAYYISHKEDELRKQKKYRRENADKIKAHENSLTRKQYLKNIERNIKLNIKLNIKDNTSGAGAKQISIFI